ALKQATKLAHPIPEDGTASPAAQQQPAQHHDAATTENPADARGEGDEETVE
ncbi:hypothetical protein M885DRAFT_622236, partial [Pelagophyceae sp. CCMP2097]